MPYKLSNDGKAVMESRGGKWVALKRYPNHSAALAYLRALETNVPDANKELSNGFKAFTGQDGAKYLWLWTSNTFKDREKEMFTHQAWEDYLSRHKESGKYGRVWFWHIKGTDFADVVWSDMVGNILVELAKVDPTPYGETMFHACEHPEEFPELLPNGWGTSHGYLYRQQDKERLPNGDNVYHFVEKFESTVLPKHRASNIYGGLQEAMDMAKTKVPLEKMKSLAQIVGEELAAAKLDDAASASDLLEQAGIDHKELGSKAKGKGKKPAAVIDDEAAEDPEEEAAETSEEEDAEDAEDAEEVVPVKGKGGAKKEAADDTVMELEVDDDMLNAIASRVNVKEVVKAAMVEYKEQLAREITAAVATNIKELVESTVLGSKETVVQQALSGHIRLTPFVASQADSNIASKKSVKAQGKAKSGSETEDIVHTVIQNLLGGF